MNLQNILDEVDERYPNALTTASKVRKLNNIQNKIFRYRAKETVSYFNIVADQPLYTISMDQSKIRSVIVDGVSYENESIMNSNAVPSYYYYPYQNDSIGLYPTPTESVTSGLCVVHLYEPTALSASSLSAVPELDDDFHMLLVYGLCAEIAEIDGNSAFREGFVANYNVLFQEYLRLTQEPLREFTVEF